MFMLYVDLDELPTLFRRRWLWSMRRPNVAWFRRRDHLGPPFQPLAEAVRDLAASRLGRRPAGPIRLLTHFRYFGFAMNPVSLYYCFDEQEQLDSIIAEVTNTPWGEQHCYVLDARNSAKAVPASEADGLSSERNVIRMRNAKELHVSPFFGMDIDYEFRFNVPAATLTAHIANRTRSEGQQPVLFDASLSLHRRPFRGRELARVLCRYPLMTVQVFAGIYWQAFRLWRKRVPYVPHPNLPVSGEAVSPAVHATGNPAQPAMPIAPPAALRPPKSSRHQKVHS
jgi:DUF1365 family protein